jgi:molybdate transport system substrate-binding protein
LEHAGLWPQLEKKIVYAENARQAYELARSGNADAVLTAWTFVQNQGGQLLPGELHEPIRQVGGVVSASKHSKAAAKALEFLTSREGRSALQRYGLFPPLGGR